MFVRSLPLALQAPVKLGTHLVQALALYRTRRVLAGLTDAQLADVGLTRADAEAEAARPIWDAPADAWNAPRHWRC